MKPIHATPNIVQGLPKGWTFGSRYRACTRKAAHPNLESAYLELYRLRQEGDGRAEECRVYQCFYCSKYHIGNAVPKVKWHPPAGYIGKS